MLKVSSPIIPIISAQKGGKMQPLYNVLGGLRGYFPLVDFIREFIVESSGIV